MLRLCAALLLVSCGTSRAPVGSALPPAEEPIDESPATPVAGEAEPERPATPIADQYREVAQKIIDAAEADQDGWRKLAHLTDRIGHRLSGSPGLDKAIEWSIAAMKADGHQNVRGEKVMVPHWVRGEEWGRITAPVERPLALLQLGGSGATGKKGTSRASLRTAAGRSGTSIWSMTLRAHCPDPGTASRRW